MFGFAITALLLASAGAVSPHCSLFDYPTVPTDADTGFIVSLTQDGASTFANSALAMLTDIISTIVIPDFNFSIDLGVTRADIYMKNVGVTSIDVEKVSFMFLEQAAVNQVSADGIGIDLTLDFKVKLSGFLPITDEGWGEIHTAGGSMLADVALLEDPVECPYHMKVDPERVDVNIGSLDIKLHSDMSAIYDAIFALLEEELVALLNKALSTAFATSFVDFANTMTYSNGVFVVEMEYCLFNERPSEEQFGTDLRQIGNPRFHDGSLAVRYPGFSYLRSTPECYAERPGTLPDIATNDDLQFIMDKTVFSSAYYTWHKYDHSYQGNLSGGDEYLTMDLLEAAFPGFTAAHPGSTDSDIHAHIHATDAPHADEVKNTGVLCTFTGQIDIYVGDKLAITIEGKMLGVGTPDAFTAPTTVETLNSTGFYLKQKFYDYEAEVTETDGDYGLDEDGLDSLLTDLLAERVAPAVTEIMKTRTIVTSNGDYLWDKKPRVVLYPPNHMVIAFNY